jgi:hypothetical protein
MRREGDKWAVWVSLIIINKSLFSPKQIGFEAPSRFPSGARTLLGQGLFVKISENPVLIVRGDIDLSRYLKDSYSKGRDYPVQQRNL